MENTLDIDKAIEFAMNNMDEYMKFASANNSDISESSAKLVSELKAKLKTVCKIASKLVTESKKSDNDKYTKQFYDLYFNASLLDDQMNKLTDENGNKLDIKEAEDTEIENDNTNYNLDMLVSSTNELVNNINELKDMLTTHMESSTRERQELVEKIAIINEKVGIQPEKEKTKKEQIKYNSHRLNSQEIEDSIKDITYNGQARLINVFGSASYGITTTALSLGYKLYPSARVLIIDFDLSNPNLDEYMQIIPVCKGIPGFPNNGLESTSMGILMDKGVSILKNYSKELIKRKETARNGYLDYMSGIYYRIDDDKLLNFDYSGLFNYLSVMYDYIILDIGKFGSNIIKDNILKKLIRIPEANTVAVTQCNRFKIRNFINALKEFNINPKSVTFILNMCESTILSDTTKKVLKGLTYYLISDEYLVKQTKSNFATVNDRIVRSQFNITLQSIL